MFSWQSKYHNNTQNKTFITDSNADYIQTCWDKKVTNTNKILE